MSANWIWDTSTIEEGRFNRAMKEKPAFIDEQSGKARFEGTHGVYNCTLSHCDCPDFGQKLHGNAPCKHILALGLALGAYNPEDVQRSFDGIRAVDRLSLAYGRYYLFRAPIISDEEYDALKEQWRELIPGQNESVESEKDQKDMTKQEVVKLLEDHGLQYVDRMEQSGCFWIEMNKESETVLRGIRMDGLKLNIAASARAFGNKPAYYYRKR